jgi:hypothetical protein
VEAPRNRHRHGEFCYLVAISGDATRPLQQQTHVFPIAFVGAVDVEETGGIVKKNVVPKVSPHPPSSR